MKKNNLYLKNLADKCTNCGNCRIICPVFKIKKEEIYSTRGRINLIKGFLNKELNSTKELKNKIFICLNCKQCASFCPADVEYIEIMTNSKPGINQGNKFFNPKNFFFKKLFSEEPQVTDFYFKILKKLNNHLFKSKKLNFASYVILKIFRLDKFMKFSAIPDNNFFKMNIRHKLKDSKGFRIALFLGCGGKYLYPETSDNFVNIMRTGGIEVIIPKDQVCCGNPLNYRGLMKYADRNMSANTSSFNSMLDIKYIVSLCPNAANLLKEHNSENSKPGLRFPVKECIEFIIDNQIAVNPKYDNSIIYHSCPKCGNSDIYSKFVKRLYEDYTHIPEYINDFCGSTELLDKSNCDLRNSITQSFIEKHDLKGNDFIACSSFECVEHLNEFFINNKMTIKAIHFLDAIIP
ncbi:MAG: (Fe-S)-binding protein [Candidatus Delongbacteria bacterium]|nr:(Fe-S)-binding protein [Candidatus Delongbacteria bacterium]